MSVSAMKLGKLPAKTDRGLPRWRPSPLALMPADRQLLAEKPAHLLPLLLVKERGVWWQRVLCGVTARKGSNPAWTRSWEGLGACSVLMRSDG